MQRYRRVDLLHDLGLGLELGLGLGLGLGLALGLGLGLGLGLDLPDGGSISPMGVRSPP